MPISSPLVSVIIPLYNRVELIGETLQSVINQTYPAWEAIIIDDGSSDGSYEKVHSIADSEPRIKLLKRNREPKGANTCRNIGLENAIGELIVFLDSDDLLEKSCLTNRVAYFNKYPDEDFLVFPMYVFDKDNYNITGLWNEENDDDDLTRFFKIDALWGITGAIYKKNSLLDTKGFRESLLFWQDFDLHLRFLLLGKKYRKFLNTNPDCFIRRQMGLSISSAIPFTASLEILKKRIEFYEFIIQHIIDNDIRLSQKQNFTIWSMIGYFNRCYLLEHKQLGLFKENYLDQRKKFNRHQFYPRINYLYDWILYYSTKSRAFILLSRIFKGFFKNFTLDVNILSNNTMLKVSAINKKVEI